MGIFIVCLIIGFIFIIFCLAIKLPDRSEEHKYDSDDPIYLAWRRKNPKGSEDDYYNWLNKADSGYLDWLKYNPYGDEVEYQMWLDCDIWDED